MSDLVKYYDVLFRDTQLIWRYYRPFSFHRVQARNVFMVDGKIPHGGMFDRLKGAISIFAVSKIQDKPFKLNFVYPFDLRNYLEPNEYDWTIEDKELCYHFPSARPIRAYGEYHHPIRLYKNRQCESHFYYGYDSLDKINSRFNTHFDWGTLYRELFRPTPNLASLIETYKREIGGKYIVIHLRFLNLLGDKVETDINPELPDSDKATLMCKCFRQMEDLSQATGMRVMLASDSMRFIEYATFNNPDIYVVPGKVQHIDTAGKTQEDENLKLFVDYHLIAGAEKVYNIVGQGMWQSAFSEYPAKIGQVEFERIFIK